jgi:hypothetical protein
MSFELQRREVLTMHVGVRGQSTVEAAYLLPVVMLLLLMLAQPGIMLYDLMVMNSAAAEGCRLLATRTVQGDYSDEKYKGYVARRLSAIPAVEVFHVRQGAVGWDLSLEGDEASEEVGVRISNRLKPLPLLGWGAEFAGLCDSDGYLTQEVEVRMPTQPSWVWENSSGGPLDWTTQW